MEVGLSHFHLCEDDEDIKALAVYMPHRVGRCNFVELKGIQVEEESRPGLHVHLMRLFKTHLGRLRYGYILFQALEEEVRAYNAHYFFAIEYSLLPDDV